jgi:predicted metal-dependent hydrolase
MDARLREGIGLFNQGRFFESHEILEQLYHETEEVNKPFFEGLIQLAAAFRLYADFGSTQGPVRMIYQALIRFENYQPAYLEIKVKEMCETMETWAKQMEGPDATPTSAIPKIRLQGFSFFS